MAVVGSQAVVQSQVACACLVEVQSRVGHPCLAAVQSLAEEEILAGEQILDLARILVEALPLAACSSEVVLHSLPGSVVVLRVILKEAVRVV